MSGNAIVVFTAKSVERLLAEGGTSSWGLDRNNARQREFAICTRNTRADFTQGDGFPEGHEPHGSAFLVGRISDVVPSPENEERWLIKFSEYARIALPEAWKGWRNPVHYTSLEELGIDPAILHFEPMPPTAEVQHPNENKVIVKEEHKSNGLTIPEAKKGLALTFGVSPDAIEIIIRG
jgi:hypothetical protein